MTTYGGGEGGGGSGVDARDGVTNPDKDDDKMSDLNRAGYA